MSLDYCYIQELLELLMLSLYQQLMVLIILLLYVVRRIQIRNLLNWLHLIIVILHNWLL